MSAGQAIYAKLIATTGVTDLVGTRIYPLELPQDVTYPAIRYQQVSGPRSHVMGADTGTVDGRFQVDAFATTYSGAKALAAQIRLALSRWGGTAGGVTVEHIFLANEHDRFESDPLEGGTPGVHRVLLDFIIHYEE